MASAILYGIAQEILKSVGSSVIQEIASAWGFKSDLEKLERNVSTIKDYLADAEERQGDSKAVGGWLLSLTEVVYAADDLLDEFGTVATRKHLSGGNELAKEVTMFFSRHNQIAYAASISRRIKAIREELDAIVKVGNGFDLARRSYEQGRVIKRRDESYSLVEAGQVIGRDADKNVILDLLLAPPSADEHDVIGIVGIGGMGKTALAQLIYNDPLVEKNFGLRLWVCVSDVFDIKEITEKILRSATNSETPKLEMDQLQSRLRAEVGDKKYLLVLDDVWNENREKWVKMRALLKTGRSGSKILITTRLGTTARIMCTVPPHDLRGLSKEKSWELFEKVAFVPGQMTHLVDMGKDIVEKCANVPLAIRVLGSVLYGKDESKWLSIKNKSLAKMFEKGDIMSILKLSYYNLESPLKNCFAYCALFPKDYVFNKDMLMGLWMAEGFIAQPDESQSLEELGEEYFLTLLQRGFFQDVKTDEWGLCIESCKMHDLMHDLAQEVAGAKCKVLKADESCHQNKIYHLSFAYRLNFQRNIPAAVLSLEHLRTLLLPQQLSDGSTFRKPMIKEITSSLTKLRVLDLHGLGLTNLPTSIGKLIHLRYLDLSLNPIRVLPDSITELHNLQMLNLNRCEMLTTLPTNIKRLVNLTSLDIGECRPMFHHMPLGIGELTSLRNLPLFTVTKHVGSARLSDLKKLNNLRGKLHIVFDDDLETTMLEAREGDLTCKHGVNELEISFTMGLDSGSNDHDEVVLEGLKPHSNLRKLKMSHYKGGKLPNWAMKESLVLTLSKLVEIELYEWNHCQIPAFSQLPLLKRLSLTRLLSVEYMETMVEGDHSSSTTLFFPSLETLELHVMHCLKGWWKGVGGEPYGAQPPGLSFPKLSKLDIHWCTNLTSLPSCPNVEEVHLSHTLNNFSILNVLTASSRLTSLTVNIAEDLLRIPTQCLLQLSRLCIKDSSLVSADKFGVLFATLSSSLQCLSFDSCDNLRSLPKGLEHLAALERFAVLSCDQIDLECKDKDERCTIPNDMPWKAFKTSLRSLKLFGLSQLASLPRALRHLTNLRSLVIAFTGLRELPEWIRCFSCLETLELVCCSQLTCLPGSIRDLAALHELKIALCSKKLIKRCRGPNGSDWPKIQHVPRVILKDYDSVV
ncbi:unnamed protein product [Cuscuta campestris]|uniref:NB-ARC domain-containing protein n=1 Tax=Cuscuta campestris TaxID=132261 RepID=A0A484KXJ7_9ASTE|nr:unnamed protein product [Cuscuta campestris]